MYDLTLTIKAFLMNRNVVEGMDRRHAHAFYDLYLKATPIKFPEFYAAVLEHMRESNQQLPRFGLIQEEFVHDPWKLLVTCCLLNLTNIRKVWDVIDELFEQYPSWRAVNDCAFDDLVKLLKPLGLQRRRAKSIIALSNAYANSTVDVITLPGVGKYASDSYKIFVEKNYDVQPTDKELIKYLKWVSTTC